MKGVYMGRKVSLIPITFLIMGMMIASCDASTVKVGYVCLNKSQKMDCHYQQFTGKEVEGVQLKRGERFELRYDIQVESGTLLIEILSPDKANLWDNKFVESKASNAYFQIEQDGLHQLVIQGEKTRGAFQIEWKIE
jgi:hypothetical protein